MLVEGLHLHEADRDEVDDHDDRSADDDQKERDGDVAAKQALPLRRGATCEFPMPPPQSRKVARLTYLGTSLGTNHICVVPRT